MDLFSKSQCDPRYLSIFLSLPFLPAVCPQTLRVTIVPLHQWLQENIVTDAILWVSPSQEGTLSLLLLKLGA